MRAAERRFSAKIMPHNIDVRADEVLGCDRCRKFGGLQRQAHYREWGGACTLRPTRGTRRAAGCQGKVESSAFEQSRKFRF